MTSLRQHIAADTEDGQERYRLTDDAVAARLRAEPAVRNIVDRSALELLSWALGSDLVDPYLERHAVEHAARLRSAVSTGLADVSQLADRLPGIAGHPPDALRMLAVRLRTSGRTAEALAAATECVAAYRDVVRERPDEYRLEMAEALDELGECLFAAGRPDDARGAWDEAATIGGLSRLQPSAPSGTAPYGASDSGTTTGTPAGPSATPDAAPFVGWPAGEPYPTQGAAPYPSPGAGAYPSSGGAPLDVVLLVPGFGGSVLTQDGKDVWGPTGAMRVLFSGGRLQRLAVPPGAGVVEDVGDGVTATRLVPGATLVPGVFRLNGYGRAEQAIERMPGRLRDENWASFPYDWRRDLRVAAKQLRRRVHELLERWRRRPGQHDARVTIVAYAEGGLVASYFAETLGARELIRDLITVGTPFLGMVNALNRLVNGSGRLVPKEFDRAFNTFTSVYQLLPRFRCVETRDEPDLRSVDEVDLPGLDVTGLEAARQFHGDLQAAMRSWEYAPPGYRLQPVVGIGQPTARRLKLESGRLTVVSPPHDDEHDGDGAVLRAAASPPTDRMFPPSYVHSIHAELPESKQVREIIRAVLGGRRSDAL